MRWMDGDRGAKELAVGDAAGSDSGRHGIQSSVNS